MENKNGLVVDSQLTRCSGTAEVDAALAMVGKLTGADESRWAWTRDTTMPAACRACER